MADDTTSAAPQKTPLNDIHRALGAKMVDFGGWDMPVEYSGIIAEHMAVRERVGLFDVSHMGEIEIRGPQALDLVEHVTTNRTASLEDGQAHYSGLLNERGGFIDDLLVHRMDANRYFLCVNAGNQDRDFEWIRDHNSFEAEVEFQSHLWAQLAIQGPKGLETLQKLTGTDLSAIRYYWFAGGEVSGASAIIARTGYTGEDGFEIYVQAEEAGRIWNEVLEAGNEFGILPCGLGARNTLRLESAMALHGHEISEDTTPYEANLGWIVKLKKGDFLGRDALVKQKAEGVKRKTVGFEMRGRGIGRDGYRVFAGGQDVGFVTSGGPAPALDKNIGIAMVPTEMAKPGQTIEIQIRNRFVEAETVSMPFYSREKKVDKIMYPADYRYTKEHEWVKIDGDVAVVGITDHAQDQLGDVVFVELPKSGAKVHVSQSFGTVESVKAVSDIYAPLSGEVAEINEDLVDEPETLNSDPHGKGWLIKIKFSDKAEIAALMSAEDYNAYVSAETES